MTYDHLKLNDLLDKFQESAGMVPSITEYLPEIPEKMIRRCCGLATPTMSEVTKIIGDSLPDRLIEILSADATDRSIVDEVVEEFKADVMAAFDQAVAKRDRLKKEAAEAAERERKLALATIPDEVRQNLRRFAESLSETSDWHADVNVVLCSAQLKDLERRSKKSEKEESKDDNS